MEETMELDIKEFAKLLWKRAWIILLCAIIVASGMLAYTKAFVTPMYKAEAMIYVNNNSNRNNGALSSSDLAVALRLVGTYMNILKSDSVLEEVAGKPGVNLTAKQIRGMMTVEPVEETEMFYVSITSSDPEMSADIVNEIARVAPEKIAAIIEGSSAKVIDYARVPTEQTSPSYVKNGVIGAVVGIVFAVAGIAVYMLLDTRVKREEDLMRMYAIPVLGRIPEMNKSKTKRGKAGSR